MYIKYLQVINFRNYEHLGIELSENVNVFIGDNAQGKTNVLESIYYASMGRSHRTSKDKEVIKWKKGSAYIGVYIAKNRLDKKIEMKISKDGKKGISVNGIKVNKLSQLFGILNVVMFSPEDLKIIKESPAVRRKFLDMELSKLYSNYYYNLVQYYKVLNERNIILKKYDSSLSGMIDIYDNQLATYGSFIIAERIKYIHLLNKYGEIIHKEITLDKESIIFRYSPSVKKVSKSIKELQENILHSLKQNRDKDIIKKTTSIGPHRDDFIVKINDMDARSFASQGQQRTATLTIKFASMEIIKDVTGEYPVLLLDDVLSELDFNRQKYILNSINNIQTIITCTGIENIEKFLKKDSKIFKVCNGNCL